MNKDKKRIILTTAVGYNAAQCFNFLASLRNSGYSGSIVFFVDSPPSDLQQLMQRFGVTPMPFPGTLLKRRFANIYPSLTKFFFPKNQPKEKQKTLYANWLPLISSRFIAYQQYLNTIPTWYDECFLCDVSDIIFQEHPFDNINNFDITFYEETASIKLKDCPCNRPWIEKTFNKKALKTWGDNPTICAGTTHLQGNGIKLYLDTMVDILVQTNQTLNTGPDQAIHNFIARRLNLPQTAIIPQSHSKVLNIGTLRPDQLSFNNDGLLTNAQGDIAAIVHQYDRHPDLFSELTSHLCLHTAAKTTP